MFRKILIVESIDSILLGLSTSLQNNFGVQAAFSKDGDSGMLKIKRAVDENTPFDLVITSLKYADNKTSLLKVGEDFIDAARYNLPRLKILVYSDDTRAYRIHKLFHQHKINAFVAHGPDSMPEIIDAVKMLYTSGVPFISPRCLPFSNNIPDLDVNDFDRHLLKQLASGRSQPEISSFFVNQGITHASVSTIEKRINRLRFQFEAVNTVNLIALAKDAGII